MMKQVALILIMALGSVTSAFCQNNPAKFGLEIEANPFHLDNFTEHTFFSFSGYIGFYSELSISKQFTTKFSAGLHNIYCREYAQQIGYGNTGVVGGYGIGLTTKANYMNMLELAIEPRYYLFPETKSQGNFYAALPVSIETAPLKGIGRTNVKLKAIPSVGYRYLLSEHWVIEANGGLGWGKTLSNNTYAPTLFEYSLQARIGYTF